VQLKRKKKKMERKRKSSQDLQEPKSKSKCIEKDSQNNFGNMRLRRIVKENHGHDISQLSFFFNNKNITKLTATALVDTSNILGSVGGCEVNYAFF
jgi:hypothetical protein